MFDFFKKTKDKIEIYRSYDKPTGYGAVTKEKKISIEKFLLKIRSDRHNHEYGFISTKFNGVEYPVHDLDSVEKYGFFKQEIKKLGKKYVIFRSSKHEDENNHYWAIIDDPIKNVKKYQDTNWHVINDKNYVAVTQISNHFFLRFTYDDLSRKPIRIEKTDGVSDNFKKFILKFEKLIENEGLELSALITRNPELLITYNRKQKLKNLSK